jgi:hypothetical protein
MAYLSYLGSHWTLFVIVVLLTAGLLAMAWFTKNLKWVLGAVVLVAAGLAYQSSNIDGYKRKASEDAMAQVQLLKTRLLTLSMINAADAQRATADAYFKTKLETLASDTPPNAGACLDAAAAHRVWAVRSAVSDTAPVPSLRHSKLLPWR